MTLRRLLVQLEPPSRPMLHRCPTAVGAVWRRRRRLAWLSVVVEEWCSSAGYAASKMATGYFEQHKLQLLATWLGVCRSGRYLHPPLVEVQNVQFEHIGRPAEVTRELDWRALAQV